MPVASSWLTAARVGRLPDVLAAIPERLPAIPEASASLLVWNAAGGPMDEVPVLIEVLVHSELVRRELGGLRLSAAGRRALARHRPDSGRPLALALIRAGLFHDQARLLLDTFPPDQSGAITCRHTDARRAAPQLIGLMLLWPDTRDGQRLILPPSLVAELTTVWALLRPPSDARGDADRRRKSIGDRAEAYSYQLERLGAERTATIVWVAQDDDTLGYDIEDRSTTPRRRIEVKGSGGLEPRFFMSDNEWRKAHDDPDSYEVHFWGGIDLNRIAADEYVALRASGFPVVLRNLPSLEEHGAIVAVPDRWRVQTAPGVAGSYFSG